MSEVVSVNLEKDGMGIGNTRWELYCLERGIQLDGTPDETIKRGNSFGIFFNEIGSFEHVPRSIMCDLEPTILPVEKVNPEQFTAGYLTRVCFESVNRIVNYNPRLGKCPLLFSGNTDPIGVNGILNWYPTELQWKILYQPHMLELDLAKTPRGMLSNAIEIEQAWTKYDHKFDLMCAKRHFVLGKGTKKCEFSETGESSLEENCKEVDSVDRECEEQ